MNKKLDFNSKKPLYYRDVKSKVNTNDWELFDELNSKKRDKKRKARSLKAAK